MRSIWIIASFLLALAVSVSAIVGEDDLSPKYDISPKVMSYQLMAGDILEKNFSIKSLERKDTLIVEVSSESDFDYWPKTFSIPSGEEREIIFKLYGLEGKYTEKLQVNIKNKLKEVTEEVIITYQITQKKEIGNDCIKNDDCNSRNCVRNVCIGEEIAQTAMESDSWTRMPPEFFYILGSVLVLLLIIFIIRAISIHNKKREEEDQIFKRALDKL